MSTETARVEPYTNGVQLLADLLGTLDERIRVSLGKRGPEDLSTADRMFHGLVVTDGEVREMLSAPEKTPEARFLPGTFWEHVRARVEATKAAGQALPLETVRDRFGLSTFEIECLVVALAPEIDPKYEKLFGYLNDDVTRKQPTVDLILRLLCSGEETPVRYRRYLLPNATLFRAGLLAFTDEMPSQSPGSHLRRCVRVEPGVVQFLLEERQVDPEVESHWLESPYPPEAAELWRRAESLAALEELVRENLAGSPQGDGLVCVLSGRPGSGRRYAAESTCARIGLPTIALDCRRVMRHPQPDQLLAKAFRDSALHTAPLILGNFEAIAENRERAAEMRVVVQRLVHEHGWMVFLCVPENAHVGQWFGAARTLEVAFPSPDIEQRREYWRLALRRTAMTPEEIDSLADELSPKFRMTAGEIAVTAAKAANSRQGGMADASWADRLRRAAPRVSAPRLGELAQEIKPLYTWDQLVLPASKVDLVRDVVRHVRHRRRVMEEWGFGKRLSRGKGLNVLFAGPSGTGKTMAAEVIANALGMPLYRIDLAGVVSKYIGETEKNLARIFQEAQHSDAILLFDEADALFGKRSEVRDAHDRYANIEINYLLQLIENHEGITILATNLRHHLDEAFLRRVNILVEFPSPAHDERLRIWQQSIPAETHSGEIDFQFLARAFDLNGGHITGIALNAAFLAAEEGSLISMRHVVRATRRELEKGGKRAIKEDFGAYAGMLNGAAPAGMVVGMESDRVCTDCKM